jgi:hypothetical protein
MQNYLGDSYMNINLLRLGFVCIIATSLCETVEQDISNKEKPLHIYRA